MNRIVRDMCKKLGKQAKLTLVGEDTEVDKTIVGQHRATPSCTSSAIPWTTALRRPLRTVSTPARTRWVRSSSPPATPAARSIIEIIDDGQGVNYDGVLAKAIRNGLAFPDVEYSHKEILNFLMAPGFSTNTEVTEFSGRGVGMDVVKRNVEEVGGVVSISSEPARA